MRIEEVATRIGVSVQTLNRWYKFKRENPNHELSTALPEYRKQRTIRGWARVWDDADIWKLAQFKLTVKGGRTGLMGKYDGRGTKNGKSEDSRAAETNARRADTSLRRAKRTVQRAKKDSSRP